MMRVAYFAPLLTTGGTQRHLQQVLRLLDRERFGAEVFTLRRGGEIEAELLAAGVPVTSLDIGPSLVAPRSLRAVLRAARALRARGVRVVHGYQWRPALVGVLAARLARVPLVLASKRSLTEDDGRARRAWRFIARRADTLIVNAEALRAEAEAQRIQARWALIPNGVDVAWFGAAPPAAAAKAALGLDPRRPVVGTVGRLEERKGHPQFLAAAQAMLARANGLRPQLLLVGDGPLRGELAAQAARLGVAESVTFAGAVADVRPSLAAMDVFVLPSRAEGMSNALLEAMAAGRPIVATAVGGTREVLDDATGVLVPPDDPDALMAAMLGLLADPSRAAGLGTAARRAAEERFGVGTMVAQLEDLYAARLAVRGEAA